jgi:hypothetical protein
VKKKWYNFFVVEDQPSGATGEPAPPPRRAEDVAPETGDDAALPEPVKDPTAFADIYRSARIAEPPHAYTVLKVAEMLQSEHLRSLPPEVKAKSILVALDAAGVSVAEIVEDAVRRDRALDTYERVMEKQVEELRTATEKENRALLTELAEKERALRARIAENEQGVRAEQEQLAAWRTSKHVEESRIAEAVGYFVSENPITRNGPPADQSGGTHGR